LRDADNKKIMNHLYCIAGDNSSYLLGDGTWVAVGQAGMILVSGDDGNTWEIKTATKINGSTVTENLRGVRYGGGVWVACGDAGIVIVSYDGGQTWEQTSLPAGFEKRQLNSIDYAPSWDTFNIGGDGCILNSSATTINFLAKLSIVASEKNSFSRLWNRGSHTNIQTTGVATDISTQLLNGQTVSSTVIDTAYYEGDEITYYFVAGSVLGTSSQVVKTGGSVITVTEYKK
jgi:photosystem II stability/assembly factor-like uncharacterized protein